MLRGDWAGAAQAAFVPLGVLLLGAFALALPKYGQGDEVVVGYADRMRIALALLLKSVGGGFSLGVEVNRPANPFGSGGGSDGPYGSGGVYGGGGAEEALSGSATLSLVPFTVTLLWIVALVVGVRLLRGRMRQGGAAWGPTAGLEAAVRLALLVGAGTLVLALVAQPDLQEAELSSAPLLSTLGALLLALLIGGGMLERERLRWWLAARPGARTAVRAGGTALRALGAALALSALVTFLALTQVEDLDELTDLNGSGISPLLAALLLLPNIAVSGLSLAWGAPVEAEASGASGLGGGSDRAGFGLSELADVTSSGAVVGALALGTVCALLIGVLTARRSANRGEQLLAAGLSYLGFLLLVALGGIGVEGAASPGGPGGGGSVEAGTPFPEAMLFGLLWIGAATFLAPFLLRLAPGASAAPGALAAPGTSPSTAATPAAPATSAASGAPGTPAAPTTPTPLASPATPATPAPVALTPHQAHPAEQASAPTPYPYAYPAEQVPGPYPGPYQLGPVEAGAGRGPGGGRRRSPAVVWSATLVCALLLGGGAAAGVVLWDRDGGDGKQSDDKAGSGPSRPGGDREDPTGGATDDPAGGEDPATGDPGTQDPGTQDPDVAEEPTGAASVPAGYHEVSSPMGYSFAVPDGWQKRKVERGTQTVFAPAGGPESFVVGVITDAGYTSYDNFLSMERTAKKRHGDYRRIRLEPNIFQGRSGAVWEYTYTDEAGRLIHAKDQGYVDSSGTEYATQLLGPDEDWDTVLSGAFDTALDTWRLSGSD
ncbi:hypothetical protein DUI70_2642 [Streptomyces albus]|nr:hypothetical protein DUI70_2642 [Streptomyces albus]